MNDGTKAAMRKAQLSDQPGLLHDDELEMVVGGSDDRQERSGTVTTGYFKAGTID